MLDTSKFKVINKINTGLYNQDVTDEFIRTIDEQLEKGSIVGISYLASILYSEDSLLKDTAHASSIVDRRFSEKSGQCEYLIRNSHGKSCSPYSKKLDCKDGQIWLPKDQLHQAIYGVTYVE